MEHRASAAFLLFVLALAPGAPGCASPPEPILALPARKSPPPAERPPSRAGAGVLFELLLIEPPVRTPPIEGLRAPHRFVRNGFTPEGAFGSVALPSCVGRLSHEDSERLLASAHSAGRGRFARGFATAAFGAAAHVDALRRRGYVAARSPGPELGEITSGVSATLLPTATEHGVALMVDVVAGWEVRPGRIVDTPDGPIERPSLETALLAATFDLGEGESALVVLERGEGLEAWVILLRARPAERP